MPSIFLGPVEPTPQEARQAAEAIKHLSSGHIEVSDMPEIAVKLMSEILGVLADGRALSVTPFDTDFTPNQAAEYLNVSRPYVLKLFNEGKIPFHLVGSHKRIHLRDLKAYRDKQDRESEAALAELAAQAQEFNLGY